MIVKRSSDPQCPQIFGCPSRQAALEAGLNAATRSGSLPSRGDAAAMLRHDVLVEVAETLRRASFESENPYGCVGEAEKIAWTAIALSRCLRTLRRGEALRLCNLTGFAWVYSLATRRIIRTTPGIVEATMNRIGTILLICPLWDDVIVGVDCLDSGEEFATALPRIGVSVPVEFLDELLDEGVRDSLVDAAVAALNHACKARLRTEAEHALRK
jgi:hypothetical protein